MFIEGDSCSTLLESTVLHALTCVVGGTKTSVVVDSIDTGCSVLAVVVFAVVNVDLASGALKAQRTRATAKTYTFIISSCQVP